MSLKRLARLHATNFSDDAQPSPPPARAPKPVLPVKPETPPKPSEGRQGGMVRVALLTKIGINVAKTRNQNHHYHHPALNRGKHKMQTRAQKRALFCFQQQIFVGMNTDSIALRKAIGGLKNAGSGAPFSGGQSDNNNNNNFPRKKADPFGPPKLPSSSRPVFQVRFLSFVFVAQKVILDNLTCDKSI